jgi:hypothetical protein
VQRVSGATAFNGGVSGGTSRDMYLYAKYAEQLWGDHYPHLVLGVLNDVLRYTGTASRDPRLKRFLPTSEQQQNQLQVAGALLQITTLEAAVRAVHRVVPRDGAASLLHPEQGTGRIDASLATPGRQRSNQRQNLDARGMQLFDPVPDMNVPLAKRIETQMRPFVQRSYTGDPGYTGVDPKGLDMLRRTIELANRHGDVPTLWVTPYAPGAMQYLPKEQYDRRDHAFREAIKRLQADDSLHFAFVDFADISAFGGSPTEFFDGIHMTEKNTAKVIEQLDAQGLLAPRRR